MAFWRPNLQRFVLVCREHEKGKQKKSNPTNTLIVNRQDAGQLCKELERLKQLPVGQYQLGKAKVFMRNDPYNQLEAAREVALKGRVIKMQKVARRFIERCKYFKYKQTLKALKDNIAKRVYDPLRASVQDAGDLPYQGKHLAIVKEAIKLIQRLEEEMRVTKLLEEAIAKRDYSLLMGGTNTAKDMKFTSPLVQKAEALMKLIEEERAAVKGLQSAIDARTIDALSAAMDKIKKVCCAFPYSRDRMSLTLV